MKIERENIFTCQDLNDKEKRNLLIYDLIRKKGEISRAEITKTTGINAVSVSHYVSSFIEKKLVLEKGFDISTGGRKPELIELNSESNYVVGLDVGKTEIRAASADIALGIKARKQIAKPGEREVAAASLKLIEDTVAASKIDPSKVRAIGLGVSDPKYSQIAQSIRKKLGIDAFAGPSAACAAFAEKRVNQAADVENVLYMYSDLGEGVVLRGDVSLIASDDEKLSGGNLKYLKPWDEYLGLVESAKREVDRGVGTKIVSLANGSRDGITRDVVIDAAKADDEVALSITLGAGINLGLRISYLVNLFSPEVVVVGGGAQEAGDIIFLPIRKMVERLSFRDRRKNIKIISSELGEDAVDIGAASLAIREIFLKA